MKVKTIFVIEVEEILEVPFDKKEMVLKAIQDKKPLFDEEQRESIIDSVAYELDAERKDIKIKDESYEIIEE